MADDSCPICFTKLEVRDVAPCMECGADPREIEHALTGQHTYAELRIFGELTLILCDFCEVDFGSIDPTYFGLEPSSPIGCQYMQSVRSIDDIKITKDKFCPHCHHRLKYLKFVAQARELHNKIE